MSNEEKQKIKEEMQNGISKMCDDVIKHCIADEIFEDAAEIRDARNKLIEAINDAVDNLLPF